MARQPRVEYPGACYHVVSRGNGGGDVFLGDPDYQLFLHTLEEACRRAELRIHAAKANREPILKS
jgi:REP element-mobilizing transposase RayT